MEKQKRIRGFLASREGLKVLENKRLELKLTYEDIVSQAGLNSDDRVKRLFNPHWGIGIQRDGIEKIASVLNLNPADFIEGWYPKTKNKQQKMNIKNLDWPEVIKISLKQQQQKQQLRRRATEKGFEVNVFVPLGLVERKEQQRRSGAIEKDQINQLKEEVIIKNYTHDEFLIDVIKGQNNNNNQHLAIIGEAGAGKTTYLDKIASFIHQETEDLAIFIPLASLQGRNIKDYLINEWLPEAFYLVYPDLEIEEKQEKDFQKWLRKSNIWLLLDGLDEMGIGTKSIEEISQQLTNWLANVRVIISCRPNVWDAKVNHSLNNFSIYKTQEFNQNDIHRFIDDWFIQANKIDQGNQLKHKLEQSQHQQIYQLITNPLRLSLLCQIFYQNPNFELPETRAELYQQFVNYFYEWKPNQVEIDWTTQPNLQNDLHLALGKLSIAGLESETLFRLPLSLIKEKMSDDLFKIAWEIGWLNLVDRDEKTNEPVYAFFHPSFQEYFAALAVGDDYKFFLNYIPENPLDEKASYRVFDKKWKEIYLIWMGINNSDILLQNSKFNLLKSIISFYEADQINCYYYHFCHCLIVDALSQYQDKVDEFYLSLELVVKWAIGSFDKNQQKWFQYLKPIRSLAKKTIESNINQKLVDIIEKLNSKENHLTSSYVNNLVSNFKKRFEKTQLKEKSPRFIPSSELDAKTMIKELLELEGYCVPIPQFDPELETNIDKAFNYVKNYFELYHYPNDDKYIYDKCLTILQKNLKNNQELAIKLESLIEPYCYANLRLDITKILLEENYHSKKINETLIDILFIFVNKQNIKVAIDNSYDMSDEIFILSSQSQTLIEKYAINNQEFIKLIILRLYNQDSWTWRTPNLLKTIVVNKKEFIKCLTKIANQLKSSPEALLYIAESILELDSNNQFAIDCLYEIIDNNTNTEEQNQICWNATEILWQKVFFNEKLLQTSLEIIKNLVEFERDKIELLFNNIFSNTSNLNNYVRLLEEYLSNNMNNEYNRLFFIDKIISNKNFSTLISKDEIAKKILQIMYDHTNNISVRRWSSKLLNQINDDNYIQEYLDFLINLLSINDQSDEDFYYTSSTILSIDPENLEAIKILINLFFNSKSFLDYGEDYGELVPISNEAARHLKEIKNLEQMKLIIHHFKNWMKYYSKKDNSEREILLYFAQNIPFPEFYQAWHSNNENIHPEMKEITPVGETEIAKQFNQQLKKDIYTDLKTNLKPTAQTYPIVIDLSILAQTTDIQIISNEFCYQIYQTTLPNAEIPEVNNSNQLKRLIKNVVEKTLNVEKIVLVLTNGDPYPELETFCQQMINSVYLGWVTNKILNSNLLNNNHFRSFTPDQTNLTDIIQNWIDGIK